MQLRFSCSALHRCGATALSAATIALLATMPTASAFGGSVEHAGRHLSSRVLTDVPRPLSAPGELLSPAQLQTLLAALPLRDLSAAQLTHYLAGLEGVSVLASLHVGLLGTEELGLAGLEESLSHAIEQLGPAATIGELADTAKLLPGVEAQLDNLLTALLGSTLGAAQQYDLSEALATLNLDQLVGALLASANEPAQLSGLTDLVGKLFGELGTAGLEGVLGGSPLSGGFTPATVENVAHELSTTPEAISSELGQTAAQLPATTTMLTAPLADGKLAAVAPAVKGLALGLLGAVSGEEENSAPGEAEGKGGSGSGESKSGSGEGKGGGPGQGGSGQGGSGVAGTGGGAGTLTLVVSLPNAQGALSTATSTTKSAKPKLAILSWRTKGALATITLKTPAAGRLAVRGAGVRASTHTVARAQRLALKVRLSKAGGASLRHRRGRLKVKLHPSFRAASGPISSATTTLSFR